MNLRPPSPSQSRRAASETKTRLAKIRRECYVPVTASTATATGRRSRNERAQRRFPKPRDEKAATREKRARRKKQCASRRPRWTSAERPKRNFFAERKSRRSLRGRLAGSAASRSWTSPGTRTATPPPRRLRRREAARRRRKRRGSGLGGDDEKILFLWKKSTSTLARLRAPEGRSTLVARGIPDTTRDTIRTRYVGGCERFNDTAALRPPRSRSSADVSENFRDFSLLILGDLLQETPNAVTSNTALLDDTGSSESQAVPTCRHLRRGSVWPGTRPSRDAQA